MHNLPPIIEKIVAGKLYKRRAQTEALTHICHELIFEEFSNRAEISARKHSEYIPSEVLMYFLRQSKTHRNDAQFGVLYRLLEKRLKRVRPRSETRVGEKDGAVAHLMDCQDFILDDFTEKAIGLIWRVQHAALLA